LGILYFWKIGEIVMKQKLIAVAALLATGASFAQVTMSGQIGFSWQQSPEKFVDGSHTQGLAVNDGDIYITAVEDLGAGWKATARGGFTMRGRVNGVNDRDGTVSLATPYGVMTAGSLRACSSLEAMKSGAVTGTYYTANETKIYTPLDACSLADVVMLNTKVGDFTLGATYGELMSGTTTFGLTDRGSSNGSAFAVASADYTNGPVKVGFDYMYLTVSNGMSQGAASNTTSTLLSPLDGTRRLRMYGAYDMGVAKVSGGYQMKNYGIADQYIAAIAIPYGNFVFGMDYAGRAAQGAPARGNTIENIDAAFVVGGAYGIRAGDKASNVLGVGMTYNLSKTTSVNVSYLTYTDTGTTVTPGFGAGETFDTTGLTTAQIAAARVKYNALYSGTGGIVNGVANTATTATKGQTIQQAAGAYDTEYRIRLLKTF